MSYPIPSVDLDNINEFYPEDDYQPSESYFDSIDRIANNNGSEIW